MKQIAELLKNNWIHECGGSWGSMIVLAAKPHQEDINDTTEIRMENVCVSYPRLNKVTKLYEYSIPHCDMAITIMELGSMGIYFITVDANQVYDQIVVRKYDIDKLTFFGPDNNKYGFTVMLFGTVNAPPFYTCVVGAFKTEWDLLFVELMTGYAPTNSLFGRQKVTISEDIFYLEVVKATLGTKSIINDVLVWINHMESILLYFQYVYQVSQKY